MCIASLFLEMERFEWDGVQCVAAPMVIGIQVRLFWFSSIACSSKDQDLRVVNEAVGNRCSHSGGVEHLSPVSEG